MMRFHGTLYVVVVVVLLLLMMLLLLLIGVLLGIHEERVEAEIFTIVIVEAAENTAAARVYGRRGGQGRGA